MEISLFKLAVIGVVVVYLVLQLPLAASIFVAVVLGLIVAVFLFALAHDYRNFRDGSIRDEITKAILHSQPTWQQLVKISEISGATKSKTYNILRQVWKDIRIGRSANLADHLELIESYLTSHERDEPYEGLPNELRVQLERLRSAIGDQTHLLEPLTTQLRHLVSIYDKKAKEQQNYTTWSFFIGVVGLLFAVATVLYPSLVSQLKVSDVSAEKKTEAAAQPIIPPDLAQKAAQGR